MLPVVSIVGRPNVGKSTLFNVLTKSRDALVADLPGVTRDRQYAQSDNFEQSFIVVDTGGLAEREGIQSIVEEQSWLAVDESDVVLWVVDAKVELTAADLDIAKQLRHKQKPVVLVVNKSESLSPEAAVADFHQCGFGHPIAISAKHTRGIRELVEGFSKFFKPSEAENEVPSNPGIKMAIVGRPNVGKSTLVNRILGEERVVVFDSPGTTRDSIYIPFSRFDEHYTIIDTAGVRRKSRITETLEKYSVIKTLQAVSDADVVVFLFNAREGVTDQDLHLLGYIIDSGRALVIAVNKWDGLPHTERTQIKRALKYRLAFIDYARIHLISALHGTGVGDLFKSIKEAYVSATKEFGTHKLNQILSKAVEEHPLPLVSGRRIKLRYAHPGGHRPPIIVIHGNQTESVPKTYTRYLTKYFRKALKLFGTPIRIEYKTSENPFARRQKKS